MADKKLQLITALVDLTRKEPNPEIYFSAAQIDRKEFKLFRKHSFNYAYQIVPYLDRLYEQEYVKRTIINQIKNDRKGYKANLEKIAELDLPEPDNK